MTRQAFDPAGIYPDDVVLAALQAVDGGRVLDFRYERLDSSNRKLADLYSVTAGSVAYNANANIRRSAKFEMTEDDPFDFGSDRIKPWVRLRMPDGGWVEWPQGVFLCSTPTRTLTTQGYIVRSVDAYDQLVALDDPLPNRWTVSGGQLYVDELYRLTTGQANRITDSSLRIPTDRDWEPGTSRLAILNDLLNAMNYRGAWFDENGLLVCEPYVAPDQQASGYTYAVDSTSVIVGDIDQTLDLFAVPNQWVLVVSNPDRPALSSTYTNLNAASPTSVQRRGRTITVVVPDQDAADQATLDALAARTAFNASQVYEQVEFSTAIMPFHSNEDVLVLNVAGLTLDRAKVAEQSWSFDLKVGATMKHKARWTVSV